MLEQITSKMTKQLVDYKIIQEEETEIYTYGFQLIVTSVLAMLAMLCIGVISHQLLITIVFFIGFIGLRQYTGGYHADTYRKCFILSCTSYVGAVIGTLLMVSYVPKEIIIIGCWCASYYIGRIGTFNSLKNPKTDAEIVHRKRMVRMYVAIISVLVTLFSGYNLLLKEVFVMVFCTQILTAAFMVAEKFRRREVR